MVIPNNILPNNIDNLLMNMNEFYNKLNDFDNRLKQLEERLKRVENNNLDYHYQEPDNSMYML